MSKIHISEQKARKIIRSLIENQMGSWRFGLPDSYSNLDDYFNIMVDEIDNHQIHVHSLGYQVREMKDKVREGIGEFMSMWREIKYSGLDDERKELLRVRILSFLKEQQDLDRASGWI
jgi:hypothetical protein